MSDYARKSWGLHAAKKWLSEYGFVPMPELRPEGIPVDAFAIASVSSFEVAIKVEMEKTIATLDARRVMYDLVQWKSASPDRRKILLFVPQGMGQTGQELLGIYDEIHEFEVCG